MAGDAKASAGASTMTDTVAKAIPWVIFLAIIVGIVRWMGAPTVIINGEPNRPLGQVSVPSVPQTVPQAPSAMPAPPTGTSWNSHGKNNQCDGKPKFTRFTCTHPVTGRSTTCICD